MTGVVAGGPGLARSATADPLFRLVAHALEAAHGRPPTAVWSAPHAFRLGASGLVAAAGWPVAAAAAPREDGVVRLSSLSHPAHSCDLPLALSGPPVTAPDWAVRTYALLRALARAGYGRGGTDLHVQGSLSAAAGLALAEPADCAVALAVADVHPRAVPAGSPGAPPGDPTGGPDAPPGVEPSRAELARLLARALPDGDGALRRAVLFARPGHALAEGARAGGDPGGPPRHVGFDPAASGSRLVLIAVRGAAADRAADRDRAVACARRAGALDVWQPGARPGRAVVVRLPEDGVADARAAVAARFRARSRPVPRFLNIAVAGAARREE
ncbi:galactokinase [Streptomyces sp. NPDC006529]|uniref:galactokinase n=1 Tax=Streptomyces sp. NPDC006529 TaxID=3157177 RepID=UPI0033BB2E6D